MADHFLDATKKVDFISREAEIRFFNGWVDDLDKQINDSVNYPHLRSDYKVCKTQLLDCIHAIKEMPAAEVRPVVLCRDCVYYNTTGCADGFGWCEGVMVSKGTSDDFFCAEGKQKPYECGADMKEPNLDTTKGDSND